MHLSAEVVGVDERHILVCHDHLVCFNSPLVRFGMHTSAFVVVHGYVVVTQSEDLFFSGALRRARLGG